MSVYYTFPEGKTKAVTMSYDDGNIQDRELVSLFNHYGIKGTFNINYGRLGTDGILSKKEIASLYQGHEIATHTMNHSVISRCSLSEAASEILEDRKGLEQLTGQIIRGHAYPYGSYNKDIIQMFRNLGIAYGRVVKSCSSFCLPDNYMEWMPTCHHSDPKLMEYAEFFTSFSKKQYLKLMYVWGHSYEFDWEKDGNSWDVIDGFCRYISGKTDIWYATNIEIFDYMEAVNRLEYTAMSNAVYNPSSQSVWLILNGEKIIEAKGGCLTEL